MFTLRRNITETFLGFVWIVLPMKSSFSFIDVRSAQVTHTHTHCKFILWYFLNHWYVFLFNLLFSSTRSGMGFLHLPLLLQGHSCEGMHLQRRANSVSNINNKQSSTDRFCISPSHFISSSSFLIISSLPLSIQHLVLLVWSLQSTEKFSLTSKAIGWWRCQSVGDRLSVLVFGAISCHSHAPLGFCQPPW